MQIVIKEPDNFEDYFPFSETHCIWEIRSGALRLFEKITTLFPNENISFIGRNLQSKVFFKRENIENNTINYTLPVLEITASFVFDVNIKNQILLAIQKNIVSDVSNTNNLNFIFDGKILARYLINKEIVNKEIINKEIEFKNIVIENVNLINYLWDVLDFQAEQIKADVTLLFSNILDNKHYSNISNINTSNIRSKNISSKNISSKNKNFINHKNIFIGKNTKIAPSAILDATNGTIFIDDNAQIMHNSVIIGPCYIGKNTIIRVGAVIYENCSFGEYCKIGGELENTIFHNYSNKQHSGFIGNSYIGEWVNLGANTNNSDLKNNYSEVTIQLPHKKIKTGKKFLGFLCGDHTKTAINSTILTGSVLGTSVMLALAKFSPKLVSSFSWLTDEFVEKYDFERAISTMQIVKYRRNKELFFEEIEMLRSSFY